jgi:hypothetical protein
MANPFITQASPMMGQTLIDPESAALQRQKQFAAALMQQNQQPQGQMVSGRFVAPSITQQLSSALNPVLGSYMMNQADTKQNELAKALRQEGVRDIGQYMSALQGKPEAVTYSAEDVGPSMNVTPATGPDYNRALSIALGSRSPMVQALGAQTIGEMTKPQKLGEGEQFVRFNPNTNKYETIASGAEKFRAPLQVDTGNAIEFRDPRDPTKVLQVVPKSLSMKDRAELADKGIIVGGGMPSSGMPIASGQGGGQVTGDAKFMPANLPTYEYNRNLSPAQNRELAGKFEADLQKNVKNAKSAFNAIKDVSEILGSNAPSSGRGENIITGVREFFGRGGEASKTDAQLKVLEQQLVQQVPRFEGPQSDKDVASYKAAAGDVGNPNIPIASRMGALQVLIDLNKKYYPNGDWDSINLNPPNIKPNMLGGTNTYFGATVQPRKETGWRVK